MDIEQVCTLFVAAIMALVVLLLAYAFLRELKIHEEQEAHRNKLSHMLPIMDIWHQHEPEYEMSAAMYLRELKFK